MRVTGEAGRRLSTASRMLEGWCRRGVPLGPLTTYRVGGRAALFMDLDEHGDVERLARTVHRTRVDVLVVGRGSNLLVADKGFAGVAAVLGDLFSTVEVEGTIVRAGAAAQLPVVARRTVAAGLTGFEWAVGVPGSIGGAVRMNAGGHGSDMAATLLDATVVDMSDAEVDRLVVPAAELGLGYRRSSIAPHHLVLGATLALHEGDPAAGQRELSEIVAWRRANQPGGHNAGSVFTNPPDDSAGRLIDAAGCKGLRIGTAEVSPKHANFIQSDDGGSADDVAALMAEVRRRVHDAFGVDLHAETRMVGFPPEQVAAAGAEPRPHVEIEG